MNTGSHRGQQSAGPGEAGPGTVDAWIDWRGGIDEVFAALMTHPRFDETNRAFAVGTRAVAAADTAMDGLLKDLGRYLVAMYVLYLHLTSKGATLPRLLNNAVVRSYLSAGRIRAVVDLLTHYGYVAKLPSERHGDPARYLPTDRFLKSWRAHIHSVLEAVSIVAPDVAPIRDGLDDLPVFSAFCRHHTETGFMELRDELQEVAFVRIFLHRHAGWRLLWELADGEDSGGALSPGQVSINGTAQRLGVSRTHVRRLLNEGARAGLIRYEGPGTVALEEAGLVSVRFFYATQCFVFVVAAQKAMAELSLRSGI
ncbi:MAG TPA: hypothetical protein VL899_08080 [Alphaproteobacteria bacterium]|nr:hypothetical protein [Alphaproteobacteria bacterium]